MRSHSSHIPLSSPGLGGEGRVQAQVPTHPASTPARLNTSRRRQNVHVIDKLYPPEDAARLTSRRMNVMGDR